MRIPTFVINDGYKGDDIQIEGLSTDVACASSDAVAEHYFRRHPGRVVTTGSPRLAARTQRWRAPSGPPLRVLVGSFTFSPVDLNCRRSDPERFLDDVMEGIAGALPEVSRTIVVKLHPADEPAHYQDLLTRHSNLEIELRSHGNVLDMFAEADIYVTTYSTSLLEAAPVMPSIYYRINEQRLGPPFEGDEYMRKRTAANPAQLTSLLRDRDTLATRPPGGWTERYLGPDNGQVRITSTIESELSRGWRAGVTRRAPDAAPPD